MVKSKMGLFPDYKKETWSYAGQKWDDGIIVSSETLEVSHFFPSILNMLPPVFNIIFSDSSSVPLFLLVLGQKLFVC